MSPSEHPRLRRSIFAVVGVSVAMIFGATPAMAQDRRVADRPPTEDPESGESGEQSSEWLEGGFDFGGSVVIDEDGTVRWNVQSENDIAGGRPGRHPPRSLKTAWQEPATSTIRGGDSTAKRTQPAA